MRVGRATAAAAAAAALAGSGCGGDATDARARDGVVRVTVREYRIDPQDWEVTAGRVRIVVTNRGRLAHNLAVESLTQEVDDRPRQYGRSEVALPGQTVRFRSRRLRPGTYRLACTLANHDRLGQWGTLRVRAR